MRWRAARDNIGDVASASDANVHSCARNCTRASAAMAKPHTRIGPIIGRPAAARHRA